VAPAPAPELDPEPGVTAADKIGGGTGGDGDGATERGFGGDGDEPGRRGPRELFARVTGGGVPSGPPAHDDRQYLSLEQATALRKQDYFPRLPASLWPTRQPYVVVVDLCVSEQGLVVDAVLQSSASRRLDPVVMAAVRTWRYQPFLVDGAARAFCHEITIEYTIP